MARHILNLSFFCPSCNSYRTFKYLSYHNRYGFDPQMKVYKCSNEKCGLTLYVVPKSSKAIRAGQQLLLPLPLFPSRS